MKNDDINKKSDPDTHFRNNILNTNLTYISNAKDTYVGSIDKRIQYCCNVSMNEMNEFDCVYDESLLGLEDEKSSFDQKLGVQDPIEQIDVGTNGQIRMLSISQNLEEPFRSELIELLKQY